MQQLGDTLGKKPFHFGLLQPGPAWKPAFTFQHCGAMQCRPEHGNENFRGHFERPFQPINQFDENRIGLSRRPFQFGMALLLAKKRVEHRTKERSLLPSET